MNGYNEQIQKKPRRTVKTRAKVLIAVAVVLFCATLAMLIYVGDYYHASDLALETLRHPPTASQSLRAKTGSYSCLSIRRPV
ncbi:MAG: hypothetical protein IJ617_02770 [Oscillospiraceae bacterium]|nr:hypothetical protein [Oscillospiraceae bacterium]